MNKRGQMYILAAVLLCIAIYGVMKVTNRLEMPAETNFDFYVENFKGERSYVVDYGLLNPEGERITGENNLLDIFTKFGSGTGIIYAEYKGGQWNIVNYLGQDIYMIDQDTNEKEAIPSADVPAGKLKFMNYIVSQTPISGVADTYKKTSSDNTVKIEISGNTYELTNPSSEDKIESIIFQNVDKNYIKVVKV